MAPIQPAISLRYTFYPIIYVLDIQPGLVQYFNAIYVISADTANPTSVYIYNVATPSWSMQATTPGGFDFGSFKAVLDHDTNVFCASFA